MKAFVDNMLQELNRAGVTVTIDPQKSDQLFIEGPCSVLTPNQVETLNAHKSDILKVLWNRLGANLPANGDTNKSYVTYTDAERKLLEKTTHEIRDSVDAVKRAFAYEDDGVTLLGIKPNPEWPIRRLSQLVQQAENAEDADLATLLRDTWSERRAICMVDGRMSSEEAEIIALEEIERLFNRRLK